MAQKTIREQFPRAANPYEQWSETPGGWDGFTDEWAVPIVECRKGPWWPVVVHYAILTAALVALVVVVAR